jgi:hypothetical protein
MTLHLIPSKFPFFFNSVRLSSLILFIARRAYCEIQWKQSIPYTDYCGHALIKKKTKFSSYIREFRWDRVQSLPSLPRAS